MNIIPKLNLNANPKNIDNNSLVDAMNLMLSKDGVIQTENAIEINQTIKNAITRWWGDNYIIVHCAECNEELIIFIQPYRHPFLSLFRYNEKENKCVLVINNFEYNNGYLLTAFTYNKNNLILAISEYDYNNTIKVPLRVLNLGEFGEDLKLHSIDYNQLTNNKLHPIIPEVIIPNVETSIIAGSCYKGWNFIFIRYKISNNTYTDWFNTNESIFIDNFSSQYVLDYHISKALKDKFDGKDEKDEISTGTISSHLTVNVSDNSDISSNSFAIKFTNLDRTYKTYQVAVVTISKLYSKCHYSEDLDIVTTLIKYNNFKEYSISDILNKHNNYYNVKSLESYNNKLYIGNYLEHEKEIDVSNITLSIGAVTKPISTNTIIEGVTSEIEVIENKFNDDYKIPIIYDTYNNPKALIGGVTRKLDNKIDDKIDFQRYQSAEQKVYIISELYTLSDNQIVPYGYHIFRTSLYRLANKYSTITSNNIRTLSLFQGGNTLLDETSVLPWQEYIKDNAVANTQFFYPNKEVIRLAITDTEIDVLFESIGIDDNLSDDPFINNYYIYQQGHLDSIKNIIPEYYFIPAEWDWANPTYDVTIETIQGINLTQITSVSTKTNEWYNFYIHFINKYGERTKGYQINKFKINDNIDLDDGEKLYNTASKENESKNLLVYLENDYSAKSIFTNDGNKYYIKFKLNELPSDYIGYFVSYEKLDKTIIYTGIGQKTGESINGENTVHTINFYSDELNYNDKIDFSFNKAIIYTTDKKFIENNELEIKITQGINISNFTNLFPTVITKKELYVADSFGGTNDNNNGKGTKLVLTVQYEEGAPTITDEDVIVCILINDHETKYYSDIKELIPCSQINYDINKCTIANTNNSFNSTANVIKYDDSGVLFDSSYFTFKEQGVANISTIPYYTLAYNYKSEIPFESLSFKNEPKTIVFPSSGLLDASENSKYQIAYKTGVIVEPKNSIDLYTQRQLPYYLASPEILVAHNNITNDNIFPKTIRRSNAILDESYKNSWREFDTNIYKNIQENKGDIIKICNSGNILLVHTEHSLFVFDNNDSIKSENDKIQLASIDIWDINYKEIFSSKLGFGGISKEWHSIIGDFGYIWYNADSKNIFRLDSNFKFVQTDSEIVNFLKEFNPEDVIFSNDTEHNRILIQMISGINLMVLSYNTLTNTFISRHSYSYFDSFNTKNKIYLITDDKKNIATFKENEYLNAYIDIIFNERYEYIKFLESISYKIKEIRNNEEFELNHILSPVEKEHIKYAGNLIRIYSEYCDTGNIDITDTTNDNLNDVNNIYKPYWDLGVWNYNSIRDKLNNYLNKHDISDACSRVYGNYFVIHLEFNVNKKIQIETLNCNVKYTRN